MQQRIHATDSVVRRSTINLWGSSRTQPPQGLRVGEDLVIALAQEHGAALAHGVALDDYLGVSTRIAVDAQAREWQRRWRARRARALTVEGVDLTCIWELEMLAQCFQPAARLAHSLPSALEAHRPSSLVLRHVDSGTGQLVRAVAGSAGVTVTEDSATAPVYETVRVSPSYLASAASAIGLRPRARGEVVCIPYWSVYPAIASIAGRHDRLRPVAARVLLPGLGRRGAAMAAARGGWMGLPGRRARGASRAAVTAALDSVGAGPTMGDPVDAAIDAHALQTLRRLAPDTLAHVRHARRGLAASGIRLGLLSYDSEEHARMLLGALQSAGIPTLLVQHGFPARQGDPDMRMADHLAIWCEHERTIAPERDRATVTVTGNPGAVHLADRRPARPAHARRSLVLVDYPGRLTARLDSRIGMRHLAVALRALAVTRPGTLAVIRPHPADLGPASYVGLATAHPELDVQVDARTAIEPLLASVDLCIGALSTATLQACVHGVPTVFLDVGGVQRPWPFDGGAIPRCTDADGLAHAIATALGSREVAGREVALDALGVRSDAVERVVDLIAELAR